MSIEAIIQKIIEDARREGESIRSRALREVKEIEKESEKRANALRSEILEKANEYARQELEKARVSASIESRKRILEEKKTAISLVFETALKEIQALDRIEYQNLIERMLLNCEGDEEIIVSPSEKRIDSEFVDRVNRLLLKKGKKGNLRLSKEKREIPGGGFILRKERIEKNNSFRILLDSMQESLESKIAEILFS